MADICKHPVEDANFPNHVDFQRIARISDRASSFFVSLGIGILESLVRLRNQAWSIENQKKLIEFLEKSKPLGEQFGMKEGIEIFKSLIKTVLDPDNPIEKSIDWIARYTEANHQKATNAINSSMRSMLRMAAGTSSPDIYKFLNNDPFSLQTDREALQAFINKLAIHISFIIPGSSAEYLYANGNNKAPLVCLCAISNDEFAVAYHRLHYSQPQQTNEFPFVAQAPPPMKPQPIGLPRINGGFTGQTDDLAANYQQFEKPKLPAGEDENISGIVSQKCERESPEMIERKKNKGRTPVLVIGGGGQSSGKPPPQIGAPGKELLAPATETFPPPQISNPNIIGGPGGDLNLATVGIPPPPPRIGNPDDGNSGAPATRPPPRIGNPDGGNSGAPATRPPPRIGNPDDGNSGAPATRPPPQIGNPGLVPSPKASKFPIYQEDRERKLIKLIGALANELMQPSEDCSTLKAMVKETQTDIPELETNEIQALLKFLDQCAHFPRKVLVQGDATDHNAECLSKFMESKPQDERNHGCDIKMNPIKITDPKKFLQVPPQPVMQNRTPDIISGGFFNPGALPKGNLGGQSPSNSPVFNNPPGVTPLVSPKPPGVSNVFQLPQKVPEQPESSALEEVKTLAVPNVPQKGELKQSTAELAYSKLLKKCVMCDEQKEKDVFMLIYCGDHDICSRCHTLQLKKGENHCPLCKRVYGDSEIDILQALANDLFPNENIKVTSDQDSFWCSSCGTLKHKYNKNDCPSKCNACKDCTQRMNICPVCKKFPNVGIKVICTACNKKSKNGDYIELPCGHPVHQKCAGGVCSRCLAP